ncbi:MAG: glycosyltransferase family 39 protein [Bacteroidales bacterium]|jgi:hypothetical protein|nr:glycosyltransferase family 39 protein [Bacteroidales bacterium]
MLKRIKIDILFVSIFIILSALFYNGFKELNELPKGFHHWKQSMHFSIIQNYTKEDTGFLHPSINNLFNNDNTGNLILEFPILHKITAIIIQVIPFTSPNIFRWLILVLTFIGFFHAYKLANQILNDQILSFFTSLLTFVIPIVVYYGANYLVDVPAMAFGFSTIYYFEKYYLKNNVIHLIAGLLFFTLSGLLRLPVLILPISYIATTLVLRKKPFYLLWVIPSIIIVLIWYYYVKTHNNYFVSYPPSETYSYLTTAKISSTYESIFRFMIYQFGFIYRFAVFYIIVGVLLLVYRKNLSAFWITVLLVNLLGSFIYIFLWFGIFEQHDYYFVPVIPIVFLIWINIFYLAKKSDIRKYYIIIAMALLFLNCISVYGNMRQRTYKKKINVTHILPSKFESGMWYFFKDDDTKNWKVLREISPFTHNTLLNNYGILPQDTVICDFDMSPTYSLALLDKKGWTGYNCNFQSLKDYEKYANMGAKYLFCNKNKKTDLDSIQLSLLRKNLVFQKDNLLVYNITHLRNK